MFVFHFSTVCYNHKLTIPLSASWAWKQPVDFFNDMSMTSASHMARSILTVTPLPIGTVPLAGVAIKERPGFAS